MMRRWFRNMSIWREQNRVFFFSHTVLFMHRRLIKVRVQILSIPISCLELQLTFTFHFNNELIINTKDALYRVVISIPLLIYYYEYLNIIITHNRLVYLLIFFLLLYYKLIFCKMTQYYSVICTKFKNQNIIFLWRALVCKPPFLTPLAMSSTPKFTCFPPKVYYYY